MRRDHVSSFGKWKGPFNSVFGRGTGQSTAGSFAVTSHGRRLFCAGKSVFCGPVT